jgi:hypothetical protein
VKTFTPALFSVPIDDLPRALDDGGLHSVSTLSRTVGLP